MAKIKNAKEIESMRKGGILLSNALQAAVDAVKPGVTMRELDDAARSVIEAGGGTPSFLGYTGGGKRPFPSTVCISKNDEVVHGIGSRDIVLEAGDIVSLDVGCWFDGMCTDMAVSVPVGQVSEVRMNLLRVTYESLMAGVEVVTIGNTVLDIGAAVEDSIPPKKYGIVRSLVGHGVGHSVHESPNIPNYRDKHFPAVVIEEGMCLAIEPMVTLGTHEVEVAEDEWTIVTADGSDSAHFEVTIVALPEGPEILTPVPKVPGVTL
ncbi:MAG: type I methionyl aminopeptidase [Patescibacteria group bacterium]|jgi:methionyl aminopeptidase